MVHAALKEAIAGMSTNHLQDAYITPANISVGNGSDELIRSLLITTCLGGRISGCQSVFHVQNSGSRRWEFQWSVERNEIGFEVMRCPACWTNSKSSDSCSVFVVPNSPTGNALTSELAWLRILPEQILVSNDSLLEFVDYCCRRIIYRPNWVVLRTFSKTFD